MSMAMNHQQTIHLNNGPSLLTTQEVASMLKVGTSTIDKLIHADYMLSLKIGPRLHRIPKSEVQYLLKSGAITKTSK